MRALHFADDVVPLASLECNLQVALQSFSANCTAAGVTVSTLKSEAMVRFWKKEECLVRFGSEDLSGY